MNTECRNPSVYGTMRAILARLNSPQEQKNLAGNLAAIRNSSGKRYEEAIEIWPILFPVMPPEFLGTGALTCEENALLVTLQIYAFGQQGSNKVQDDESHSAGSSLQAVRLKCMREEKSATAIDRRFNTMLTATTFDEFTYHLRQIFKIGKSKGAFSMNYGALAEDLFWYQRGRDKQICLKWARDYYRPTEDKDMKSEDEGTENINKNEEAAK